MIVKQLKILAQTSLEQKTLEKNWEKYQGYIVLVVNDQIFATKRGDQVASLIKKINNTMHKQPLITVIPKKGFWILPTK